MSRSPFRHVSPGRRSFQPPFPAFQSHPSYISAFTPQYADQTGPSDQDGVDVVWDGRTKRDELSERPPEPGEFSKSIGCTSMTTCISEFAALHPLPSNATQLPRCLSTFSACRSSHSSATELFQGPCLTSNFHSDISQPGVFTSSLSLTGLAKPQSAQAQHAILNSPAV